MLVVNSSVFAFFKSGTLLGCSGGLHRLFPLFSSLWMESEAMKTFF